MPITELAPLPLDDHPSSTEDQAADKPANAERAITFAFVVLPFVAFAAAATQVWPTGPSVLDGGIALFMYVVVGFGITVGYHRMLTHRSFRPRRPLKIAIAIAGSMAFEGGPIGWVADHRRHHAFSDRSGDPHSPQPRGHGIGRISGLAHAHLGWLFNHAPTSEEHYAQDLIDDPDIATINRLFPLWCAVSLAIPFAVGYLIGGGLPAALTALLWAGGVRVFLLHHVTWSINSICHTIGARPFRTKDQSRNVAALAIASFGESWHNGHHALPRSARHGLLRRQWDSSALLIRCFERLGWATNVIWPTPAQMARIQDTTRSSVGPADTSNPRGVALR